MPLKILSFYEQKVWFINSLSQNWMQNTDFFSSNLTFVRKESILNSHKSLKNNSRQIFLGIFVYRYYIYL